MLFIFSLRVWWWRATVTKWNNDIKMCVYENWEIAGGKKNTGREVGELLAFRLIICIIFVSASLSARNPLYVSIFLLFAAAACWDDDDDTKENFRADSQCFLLMSFVCTCKNRSLYLYIGVPLSVRYHSMSSISSLSSCVLMLHGRYTVSPIRASIE